MAMPDAQGDRFFTYADYLKWPEEERWELIEGRAYAMTPAPTPKHQRMLIELAFQLQGYFRDKTCQAYTAPIDVRLPIMNGPNEVTETVVQPDLLVVCDPAKVDAKGVRGAPDLVIEILSESTAPRDLNEKLRLYEKHGVRCYIIADPWGKTLTVRYLQPGGTYALPELYAGAANMPVRIFEGLALDLGRIFAGL